MKAILTKDTKWYEENNVKQLPFHVNSSLDEVENWAGKTSGFILFAISIVVSSFVCWMISGILLSFWFLIIIPYWFACFLFQLKINQNKFLKEEKEYAICGSYADQALLAIKVVKAFNQTSSELRLYEKHLNNSDEDRNKYSWLYGVGHGLIESIYLVPVIYSCVIGGFFISERVRILYKQYR